MTSRPLKNWTRKHTLVAGLALILLTNAVALLGVHRNRSGEPESVLTLTQRELQRPYGWGMNRENSGVSLRILWRVPTAGRSMNYLYSGGNALWLDQAKMASLGFDVGPSRDMQDIYRWSSRQLSREVLLVLELDGPAYQQALQQAQQFAEEQDAKLAALPDDKSLQAGAKTAHDQARMEEQENSRLFAVDAGLDPDELRAKYPDRNRYAIVRAQVRPSYASGPGQIAGYIDKISIDEIRVPHEFHSAFDIRVRPAIPGTPASGRRTFEATVAFGRRMEPWIVGISTAEQWLKSGPLDIARAPRRHSLLPLYRDDKPAAAAMVAVFAQVDALPGAQP
ncbi:MAG TPA: DUF4824 family protein [Gallionella sp.]|nr:DUF4824 family protein [Gallionella sp.]